MKNIIKGFIFVWIFVILISINKADVMVLTQDWDSSGNTDTVLYGVEFSINDTIEITEIRFASAGDCPKCAIYNTTPVILYNGDITNDICELEAELTEGIYYIVLNYEEANCKAGVNKDVSGEFPLKDAYFNVTRGLYDIDLPFNPTFSTTYIWDVQNITYNFGCEENLTNTTPSNWIELNECGNYSTENLILGRNYIRYDANNCGVTANVTYNETMTYLCSVVLAVDNYVFSFDTNEVLNMIGYVLLIIIFLVLGVIVNYTLWSVAGLFFWLLVIIDLLNDSFTINYARNILFIALGIMLVFAGIVLQINKNIKKESKNIYENFY